MIFLCKKAMDLMGFKSCQAATFDKNTCLEAPEQVWPRHWDCHNGLTLNGVPSMTDEKGVLTASANK